MTSRIDYCLAAFCLAVVFFNGIVFSAETDSTDDRPNIVLIFTDDQGYQDVGCFGSPDIETPNLDQMAAEGRKFTDFCVAQSVCSASRAALLTGCYPNRIGIRGALSHRSNFGINSEETTIAEVLKTRGYSTAIYGKWHLGHHHPFLPMQHGFDDYFGLPYSNDMWPFHPTSGKHYPPLPLIDGNKAIEHNPDQSKLTTQYTERAVAFIEKNKEQPFFLYLAHSMPHVPLFVSDKFKGKSKRGLYGDVISEIDWSVGQVLETLKKNSLDEKTLVIFTSDNGPWLSYGNHGGSALPLREGKGTAWEGGMREPCIMRWPGRIPAGTVCDEFAATIDVLPTIAQIVKAPIQQKRIIDGKDISPLVFGKTDVTTPHEFYFYYWINELHAIRSGRWKLHFPHPYRSLKSLPGRDGMPGPYVQKKTGYELYDLETDAIESSNVANLFPEVVERLKKLAKIAHQDLGDSLTKQPGENRREPGRLPKPADR